MKVPAPQARDETPAPATPDEGLSSAEAAARLARFGRNEVVLHRRFETLLELIRFVSNPLVLLLIGASVLAAALGEVTNAVIITVMIAGSIGLDAYQVRSSTAAAERLRQSIVSRTSVLRDGKWTDIPIPEIVPGDRVRLSAGDLVPADMQLTATNDLQVDESTLTGESLPVEKRAAKEVPAKGAGDGASVAYLGTHVVAGTAQGVVLRTGASTQFGAVAAQLGTREPLTEFERGTRSFAVLIMRTVLALAVFVFAANVIIRQDVTDALLFAIALAVGMTPEYLPMITTVTLARGAVRMSRGRVIVRRLAAIEDFGSMDILLSDKTGTLTEGKLAVTRSLAPDGTASDDVLHWAALNAQGQTGLRSAFDEAILDANKAPLDATTVDEVPFDFERRRLSVIIEHDGKRTMVTKGATESVVAVCHDAPPGLLAQTEALGREGLRVLAVATRDMGGQESFTVADEREMSLAGLIAFSDPVRPDVAEAIAAMRADGIELKLLTGDGPDVARAVCTGVGLDVGEIVSGSALEGLDEAALGELAERTVVFARVSPGQKNAIILALRARGHVTGYMGDGINDAPALRTAHVGISVSSAVDVAKEAADIILLEPSLGSLHRGVIEGRRSFGNIMKYVMMGTSSNFGNVFSMAGAALFLPFLPMLPTQIILNNFLYDVAQLTIPADHVDEGYLHRPKHWDVRFIRNFMLMMGPVSSAFDFLTFGALLWIFDANETLFHTGWFVESLATQTLVIFVIRTTANPFRSRPSPWLVLTTLGSVAVALALPFTPFGDRLGFERPGAAFLAFLSGVVMLYLALAQVAKHVFYQRLAPPAGSEQTGR